MSDSPSVHRFVAKLLGFPRDVVVTAVAVATTSVLVSLVTRSKRACCPLCQRPSARIHSRYHRTIRDQPWGRLSVTLSLTCRKFRCSTRSCPRLIFTERIPTVTAPAARMTTRCRDRLRTIAFALGGEGGARLCRTLGIPISPPTLLTLIRATDLPTPPPARHIGIDDWAFRKRVSYGTIIVDLDTHRPIELLPDRTAETAIAWLQGQPQLAVVARDRSIDYATATRLGAPQADVVADRWHVLHNWREVVDQTLNQHHALVKTIPAPAPEASTLFVKAASTPVRPANRRRYADERRAIVEAKRVAQWTTIRARVANGEYLGDSAHRMTLSYRTVKKYATASACPHMKAYPPRERALEPYELYLRTRWMAGCRNGVGLYREIVAQGFTGSRIGVATFVAQLRRDNPYPGAPSRPGLTVPDVAALLFTHPRTVDDDGLLNVVAGAHRDLAALITIGDRWMEMVGTRQGVRFDQWLTDATGSAAKYIRQFALNLKKDEQAVRNACTMAWSNGQTEGHVNRLKALKRQMYGRAKFDLLRQRVLYYADTTPESHATSVI